MMDTEDGTSEEEAVRPLACCREARPGLIVVSGLVGLAVGLLMGATVLPKPLFSTASSQSMLELQQRPMPPAQYFYKAATADWTRVLPGTSCTMSYWKGRDPLGMNGYPHATKIACDHQNPQGYSAHGIAEGWFQIWLTSGSMSFNGETTQTMGSAFWAMEGSLVDVLVNGTVWVIGTKFNLVQEGRPRSIVTSSWNASRTRSYDLGDAKAGVKRSSFGHDGHICNGSSASRDFVFASRYDVDPPSVVVLNCAGDKGPTDNFVWSHFHPFGAVYIPMSGKICFSTDEILCSEPGEARWTSPNLQYLEYFLKPDKPVAQAEAVRSLAGVSVSECDRAILFGVTNFDAAYDPAGVPNFADWPIEAHSQTESTGQGPWGIFDTMLVRNTIVSSTAVTVDKTQ